MPQVLDLVGLAGKEDRFPNQLAGGEQQRVALLVHALAAVAIICVWIVHVYAAIWVKGTISAMTRASKRSKARRSQWPTWLYRQASGCKFGVSCMLHIVIQTD